MQISAVSVSRNLKANVTETFWPSDKKNIHFHLSLLRHKVISSPGCKKRGVWSDVRRKLIVWLFLLYLPGAVDKKSQENSWRYVDQRSVRFRKKFQKIIDPINSKDSVFQSFVFQSLSLSVFQSLSLSVSQFLSLSVFQSSVLSLQIGNPHTNQLTM